MQQGGFRCFALAAIMVGVCCALGVSAAAAEDPAAALYQPHRVDVIDLTLTPEARADLEAEPDVYVPAKFSLAETDGTPSGVGTASTPINIELRLKGSTSFESLNGKAAFKIKFKKTERFLGLKKMTLNNMVQDASMLHETLSYEAFRAAGVPAPRTSFAYVYVNGEDFGLHLDLETVDDQALEKIFGSFDSKTQHLYEGEDGADVVPGGAAAFEIDEGEETSRADLEALIGAVNAGVPGPGWAERVAPFADLTEMTKMWAVEKYVGQWDGYSGVEGASQPNNYYLYSEPSGRFQMLPWGTDETWQPGRHLAFDGHAGVLFNDCLADPSCALRYWESLNGAKAAVGSRDLDAEAATLAALLKPWQEQEHANSRHDYSLHEIEEGVGATREFIATRPAEAAAWLAAHAPPEVPEPEVPGSGSSGGSSPAGGSGPTPAAPQPSPDAPPALGGLTRGAGSFALAVRVPRPGTVREVAMLAGRRVCASSTMVATAGIVSLRCRLPRKIRRVRHQHALHLGVTVTLTAPGAPPRTAHRRITLPRIR